MHLTHECCEVPVTHPKHDWAAKNRYCLKYSYVPHSDVVMQSKSRTAHHGTFMPCAARILWTGCFLPSDRNNGLGMETHVAYPAVYTANTFAHGFSYAWPSNLFNDNL